MKLRFVSFLVLCGAVAAGALLFWTSQRVQGLEDRFSRTQAAAAAETRAIRVLRAEWDYLNRPDRLEALAAEYLGLTAPAMILPEGDLPPSAGTRAVFSSGAAPVPAPRPASLKGSGESFRALLQSVGDDEGGAQ